MLLLRGTTGGGIHGLACMIGIPMFPTRKNYTEIQLGYIKIFRGLHLYEVLLSVMVRTSALGWGDGGIGVSTV